MLETIEIGLTPEMISSIREALAAGDFASPDEVVRDAMRMWIARRREAELRLERLRGGRPRSEGS